MYSSEERMRAVESISPWARGFVNAMTEKGYLEGYQNRFNPKANITRAEVVKIFDDSVVYESNECHC